LVLAEILFTPRAAGGDPDKGLLWFGIGFETDARKRLSVYLFGGSVIGPDTQGSLTMFIVINSDQYING